MILHAQGEECRAAIGRVLEGAGSLPRIWRWRLPEVACNSSYSPKTTTPATKETRTLELTIPAGKLLAQLGEQENPEERRGKAGKQETVEGVAVVAFCACLHWDINAV